jgi:ABC-type arginine/histidine transport system permease subunit
VAKTQHVERYFAALHKFHLKPGLAALYLDLREAMPCAFLDVSSLNLAAFPAAIFFCAIAAAA